MELRNEFMVRWKQLVYSLSKEDFITCWDRLNRDYQN